MEEQIVKLQKGIDLLHASSNKNLGIAVLGIGIGFMVPGMVLLRRN